MDAVSDTESNRMVATLFGFIRVDIFGVANNETVNFRDMVFEPADGLG